MSCIDPHVSFIHRSLSLLVRVHGSAVRPLELSARAPDRRASKSASNSVHSSKRFELRANTLWTLMCVSRRAPQFTLFLRMFLRLDCVQKAGANAQISVLSAVLSKNISVLVCGFFMPFLNFCHHHSHHSCFSIFQSEISIITNPVDHGPRS